MKYPKLHTQAYYDLPYRTRQGAYYYWKGFKEGELDFLYYSFHLTVEERAIEAAIRMRVYNYRKAFINGYLDGAKNKKY